ncbi:3-oxoadipate enol-lactonase [Undibacterium sp.]|jgi:3-oxoadipate enol-lactonase|uniref:3-oxoadipate enol-lactonase n=1 Tax=Undibacterium sp. TaxID=1914977 RepID=UPI002C0F0B03|nr:3-oxoadipate enol-lactonase [Undibacterium sp.]HTD03910.1 3-oxoadipate enol-lactonase [Undibacterium sp.]
MSTGRINYQLDGADGAPVLVLSNSLGTTLDMWQPQMPALLPHFRVLRYDARGHGQSWVTPAPYSIAQLGGDVLALLDQLDIRQAHFCGLSMGGMIGIWLGANHPERFLKLALCNTGAKIGTSQSWNARIDQVVREGMQAIAPAVLDRWFTPAYRAKEPQNVETVRQMLLHADRIGYTGSCAAIRDMDLRDALTGIQLPVLVVAGIHDQSTPPEDGKLIAERIGGARYIELEAAHLSNWEQTELFNQHLLTFLRA